MPASGHLTILKSSPLDHDLALLFARHRRDMHAETPPESIHMLPREALAAPDVAFYVIRDHDQPVAMGALKTLAAPSGRPQECEIKSMHVLAEHRGRGLSRLMLAALIAEARGQGLKRINLETGVEPMFHSARALYSASGFVECPPFQGYEADPNSIFMTLVL